MRKLQKDPYSFSSPIHIPSPQEPYFQKEKTQHVLNLSKLSKNSEATSSNVSARSKKSQNFTPTPRKTPTNYEVPRRKPIKSMTQTHFLHDNQDIFSASMEYLKQLNTIPEDKEAMMKEVDDAVDKFFSQLHVKSFKQEIEPFLSEQISSNNVVYWEEITSLRRLYSDKYKVSVNHDDTMIGSSFYETNIQELPCCAHHPKWCAELDGQILNEKGPVIIFNLRDFDNAISGLVEVQKKFANPEMNQRDLYLIQKLQQKYTLFSRYFKNPPCHAQILEMSKVMTTEQFLAVFSMKMTQIFHCQESEIWDFSDRSNVILYKNAKIKEMHDQETGLAGYILSKGQLYNSFSCKRESSYIPVIDGANDVPFMGVPIENIVIMLRGCSTKPLFTESEENLLNTLGPYIISFFKNTILYTQKPNSQAGIDLLNGVVSFLPAYKGNRELGGMLGEAMIEIQKTTQSDRISFFKLEDNMLESVYMTGCRDTIKLKLGEGIAGHVALTGVEENFSNAADSIHFQGKVDNSTGYQTKSMLTVPIVSTEGKVRGVIQLINKLDGMPFSKQDSLIASVYGSLCTFMIHNTYLIKQNEDLLKRLNTISKTKPSLDEVDSILGQLCNTARLLLKCDGVTVFLINDAKGVIEIGGHDGHFIPNFHGKGVVKYCLDRNQTILINDTFHDALVDKVSDQEKKNILIIPIIAANTQLGAIEACNKDGLFNEIDLATLLCIANIAATGITQKSMMNVIEHGRSQLTISRFINREELGKNIIPTSFSNYIEINGIKFTPYQLSKEELTATIFHIFSQLGIYTSIKCDDLFSFISAIISSYSENDYHSWVKAVSITQFMYLLLQSMTTIFTNAEKLALISASMLVFAGHDGTDDMFHTRLNTVQSIAAGNLPVHAHMCISKALHILTKHQNKVFVNENNPEGITKLIIKLLVSSATMKEDVNKLSEFLTTKTFDINRSEHRDIFIKCLFNMCIDDEFARGEEICEKWEYLYSIERFALGTKESSNKLTYSNRHNCKELYDKNQCLYERMKEKEELFMTTSLSMVKESTTLGGVIATFKKLLKYYSK